MSRAQLVAALERKTARLYDSRTPAAKRRDLSMEVSVLRTRLMGTRDPLSALVSASPEES